MATGIRMSYDNNLVYDASMCVAASYFHWNNRLQLLCLPTGSGCRINLAKHCYLRAVALQACTAPGGTPLTGHLKSKKVSISYINIICQLTRNEYYYDLCKTRQFLAVIPL